MSHSSNCYLTMLTFLMPVAGPCAIAFIFFKMGNRVTAIDASVRLSKLASKITKQTVIDMSFQEMKFDNVFDGIWAFASLLHIQRTIIEDTFAKMVGSLKQYGILCASFKYSTEEHEKNGRYFNCYDKKTIIQLLNILNKLELLKI